MSYSPVIVADDGAGSCFVVGLGWKRNVTTSAAAEATAAAHARAEGANRMALLRSGQNEVRATAFGTLPNRRGDVHYYSLALALCLRHGDGVEKCLYALRLDEQIWVCAIVDGVVVNGFDRLLDADGADALVAEFRQRYGGAALTFYGDHIVGATAVDWTDLQDYAVEYGSRCELLPIKSGGGERRKMVVALSLFAVAGSWYFGSEHLKRRRRAQAQAEAEAQAASQPQGMTPQQAWDKAIAQWVETSSVASPAALEQALVAIGETPLEIAGWQLRSLVCTRVGPSWGLRATYTRRDELRSTTQALLSRLPPGWSAEWGALDQAVVVRSLTADASRAQLASMPGTQAVRLAVLSHLQRNSRAYTKTDLAAPTGVPLTLPPQADGKPTVIDLNKVKPQPVTMRVVIGGPLRSLLLLRDQPISWISLKLDVAREATLSGAPAHSALMCEAVGDIYAVNS